MSESPIWNIYNWKGDRENITPSCQAYHKLQDSGIRTQKDEKIFNSTTSDELAIALKIYLKFLSHYNNYHLYMNLTTKLFKKYADAACSHE